MATRRPLIQNSGGIAELPVGDSLAPAASHSVQGAVLLASSVEAAAGTDDTKALTAVGLKAALAAVHGTLGFEKATAEITAGQLIFTASHMLVDTEGQAATDDLDNLAGPNLTFIILQPAAAGRVVTVKNGTGNLILVNDCPLADINDVIVLVQNQTGQWVEVARRTASTASSLFLAKASNLADLTNVAVARSNLGVTLTGQDTTYAYRTNNLSDLSDVVAARSNLGVTATGADTTYMFRSNNLSDLSSMSAARTNLGLGTGATANTGTSGHVLPFLDGTNTWAGPQTFTGSIALTGGGNVDKFVEANTNGTPRFRLYLAVGAEAGLNAGSDAELRAYNDAGTALGSVFTVTRATQVLNFTKAPTFTDPAGTRSNLNVSATGTDTTYAFRTNNLSDLSNVATARSNLGVTATGADTTYAFRANNLSDLGNVATARTNLGVSATGTDTTYAFRANNLSDLANAATARTNLGLGSAATQATGTSGHTLPFLDGTNTWSGGQTFNGAVTFAAAINFNATQTIAVTTGVDALVIKNSSLTNKTVLFTPVTNGNAVDTDLVIANGASQGGAGAIMTLSGLTRVVNFHAAPTFTDPSTTRDNLGLTSTATTSIGTSGGTIPLCNTANSWSASQIFAGTIASALAILSSTNGQRWDLRLINTETGSGNVGADLSIVSRADSSATLGTVVTFTRSDLTSTFGGVVKPAADNSQSLGASGARWSVVWAGTSTISTSDDRLKTAIADSSLGLDFIKALRPVSYRFTVGGRRKVASKPIRDFTGKVIRYDPVYEDVPGQRTHYGLVAQEVKATLDLLNAGDFAGWVLTDPANPDSEQGLRYEQFIAPLIKAVQQLEARVAALEARA